MSRYQSGAKRKRRFLWFQISVFKPKTKICQIDFIFLFQKSFEPISYFPITPDQKEKKHVYGNKVRKL